jgi:hypothetical protein
VLKPYLKHITQAQCIADLEPLVNQCIARYSNKLPKQAGYADIHKYGYLIGSCCSIKFVNFFLNKNKHNNKSNITQ